MCAQGREREKGVGWKEIMKGLCGGRRWILGLWMGNEGEMDRMCMKAVLFILLYCAYIFLAKSVHIVDDFGTLKGSLKAPKHWVKVDA